MPSARPWAWPWSTVRCVPASTAKRSQGPAQEEEFVLMHCDNVEAAGFVSHLKLPHYVDFQAELELIRKLRRQAPAEENR